MNKLSGKVALITGGAVGIGAETARLLVARGARVVLVDIAEADLAKTAAELGDSATTFTGDVREYDEMKAAVDHAVATFGRLDVVMANAGISTYGTISVVDPASFKRVIDINLTGVFNTVHAAMPELLKTKGYALCVSSLAAYAAAPGMAAYDASKAGCEHFANSIRQEYRHRGVKVGSAHMSWIDTPLVRDVKNDLSTFQESLRRMPGFMSKTTTVRECAEAFVDGIEQRKSQINVPGWVGYLRYLKPLLSSRAGEWVTGRDSKKLIEQADEEVIRLGRDMGPRVPAS